jgi:hypothetical protein
MRAIVTQQGQPWLSVMSDVDKPAQIEQPDSVKDVERLLLEAASAIQRLIAERDALRVRVDSLERELERIRQQTTLIRGSYRRLTDEFVTQIQRLDSNVIDLFQEPPGSMDARSAEPQPAEGANSNSSTQGDRPSWFG